MMCAGRRCQVDCRQRLLRLAVGALRGVLRSLRVVRGSQCEASVLALSPCR